MMWANIFLVACMTWFAIGACSTLFMREDMEKVVDESEGHGAPRSTAIALAFLVISSFGPISLFVALADIIREKINNRRAERVTDAIFNEEVAMRTSHEECAAMLAEGLHYSLYNEPEQLKAAMKALEDITNVSAYGHTGQIRVEGLIEQHIAIHNSEREEVFEVVNSHMDDPDSPQAHYCAYLIADKQQEDRPEEDDSEQQ